MTSLRFRKLKLQPAQINGIGVEFVPGSQLARLTLSLQLPKKGVPTLPAGAPAAQLQGHVPYAASFSDAAAVKSRSNTGLEFLAVPKLTQGTTVELLGRPSTYNYWLSPTGGVSMGGLGASRAPKTWGWQVQLHTAIVLGLQLGLAAGGLELACGHLTSMRSRSTHSRFNLNAPCPPSRPQSAWTAGAGR
jgi:hypothetical protein